MPTGKEPKIDGVPDPAEWQDAACFPVINPAGGTRAGSASALVYLKKNNGNLLVAAELDGGERAGITADDQVDIWRDDAFEIHVMTADKKRYQFIINSNNAMYDCTVDRTDGVYDQSKLQSSWNSGARHAVRKGSGKWSLEMEIPLDKIGGSAVPELAVNFCATRYQDKPGHAAWGMGCDTFFNDARFGILKFTETAKPVRLEKAGFSNGMFELVLNPELKAEIATPNGSKIRRPANTAEWKLNLGSGFYDLTASGKDFYYATRIEVNPPMVITCQSLAARKTLNVTANLSGAGSSVRRAMTQGTLSGTFRLVDAQGKVYAEKSVRLNTPQTTVPLAMPELKQGTYTVTAEAADGKNIRLKTQKPFRVPDMTPYKVKAGVNHSVPYPWTPVKAQGDREFQVWNRIYTFGSGPFPVQISAGGENMLIKSPELMLAGKPVQWKDFKITEKHHDFVLFEGTGHAEGLTFKWRSQLSFDGLVKVDIFMNPAKQETVINNLKLRWSVPAGFARVMLDPLYSKWGNKDGEVYRFPYAHGQDFIIWTIGLQKGFCYWSESSANWHNAPGHKQFSLVRKGDEVTVNADFITSPAKLTKEARYTMAFMATPGRPEPARRRDFNPGQSWGFRKNESVKVQYYLISKEPLDYSTEPWTGLLPLDDRKYQKHIDMIESKGSRYMPYSQPAYTAHIEESYDYFFPEWKQIPGFPVGGGLSFKTGERYEPEACCAHTGAGDLFVWRAQELLKKFPKLPGLYYDITEGRLCWNTLHGCGGTDAFGKTYGSSNLLTHRDYFIRLKRVLGKDKILFLHAHNRFIPFTHGIGDYWFPGEQYADAITQNMEHFYCENIPLKEYQSAFYSPVRGSGVAVFGIYQLTQWRMNFKKNYYAPKYAFSMLTPLLLHDVNNSSCYINHKVVDRWWEIKHDINLAEAKFHGYWFSDAVKSASDKVYVSWYQWEKPSPYSRLLVVGNMGRTAQPAALKIDWKKLGLKPEKVKFCDVWQDKEITAPDSLKAEGNNFLLIGIK